MSMLAASDDSTKLMEEGSNKGVAPRYRNHGSELVRAYSAAHMRVERTVEKKQ